MKPQSKTFQLRPEYPTVPQLDEAFTSLGKENYVKIVKESGHGVSIHGLRADDIHNCWLQLKEFVDSRVTVIVNIDLGYWQIKFLKQKYRELFTSEEKNEHEIRFPSFTLPRPESQDMTVVLTGRLRSTKRASDKVKTFCSAMIIKSAKLHCKTRYIKLWKKRWENITAEQNQMGVLVDFRETQSESDQVLVDVTVVSSDSTQTNKAYNDIILIENGSKEKLSKHNVNLNTAQFAVLCRNLSICREKVEKAHSVVIELEMELNKKLTILTFPGNDAALTSAEIMLIRLISSLTPQQPTVKELVCKDDLTVLLFLTSKSMYFSRLKIIADQYSVEVLPIKDKKVLKLIGTETNIKIVEDKLNTLMTEVRSAVECTQLTVSEHHYSILSTDSFKKVFSEMQLEGHVICSHHSSKKVLRQALLKSQLDHNIMLKIIVGSLAGETADAIVVPAGTQDPKMINSEMAENFTAHMHHESKTLNVGDVICLPSGSYPSKLALHVVLPESPSDDRKNFVLGCWSCIQIANSKGLKSLSFPMLGVDDKHKLPADSCIISLLACINHFMSQTQVTSLDSICIVITDDDAAQVLDSFDKYKFKSQSAVATVSVQPSQLWYWNDDNGQYSEYPQDITDKLNQAKDANPIGMCYFQISGRSYAVDFSRMIQINIDTRHTRKVLCKKSCLKPLPEVKDISGLSLHKQTCATKPSVLGSAQWYYKGDGVIFVAYSFQDSAEIEIMFQKHIPKKCLTIDSRTYSFDFERMKQINIDSGYKCDLKREETAQNNAVVSMENEFLPKVEYYVNIQGLKIHLKSAKQRIIKMLNTLCVSKTIQLPISSTSKFVQKLNSIARCHKVVSCYDDKQAACHSSLVNQRYINIKGAEQLVHRAVTEIQDEIIKFQSTQTTSVVEYPPEWEPCLTTAVTAQLIELSQYSIEWKHVADQFKETMPSAEIISIKRIQNKWLWEKYAQTKKRMHQKNSGVVNEKELWHGSRTNAESIYDSEEGFDMRFSLDGMWGRANYFATEARYSVKYAYQRDDGTKELFLAKVLTGNSFESPPNKTLTMPPEKLTSSSSNIKLKQVRYDSVTGITHKCRVYMTYSNERAYPAYLVQFSVTPTLLPTSPSQTHISAMALTQLKLAGFTN